MVDPNRSSVRLLNTWYPKSEHRGFEVLKYYWNHLINESVLCFLLCFLPCLYPPKYFNYSEKNFKLFNFKDEGEGGGSYYYIHSIEIE